MHRAAVSRCCLSHCMLTNPDSFITCCLTHAVTAVASSSPPLFWSLQGLSPGVLAFVHCKKLAENTM